MQYEDYLKLLNEADSQESILITRHDACVTLGKNSSSNEILQLLDVPVYQSNRGGGATYHDQGQLVLYPRIDLKKRGLTITDYIDLLEQWGSAALLKVGVKAIRKSQPGLWIKNISDAVQFESNEHLQSFRDDLKANSRLAKIDQDMFCEKQRTAFIEKAQKSSLTDSAMIEKLGTQKLSINEIEQNKLEDEAQVLIKHKNSLSSFDSLECKDFSENLDVFCEKTICKKVAFIGLAVRNGFTEHGISFNLRDCNLSNFAKIIPCNSFEKIGKIDTEFELLKDALIDTNPFHIVPNIL